MARGQETSRPCFLCGGGSCIPGIQDFRLVFTSTMEADRTFPGCTLEPLNLRVKEQKSRSWLAMGVCSFSSATDGPIPLATHHFSCLQVFKYFGTVYVKQAEEVGVQTPNGSIAFCGCGELHCGLTMTQPFSDHSMSNGTNRDTPSMNKSVV